MPDVDRRAVLRAGVTAVLAGHLTGAGWVSADSDPPTPGRGRTVLDPVRDLRDGQVRLALPRGFRYRSFDPAGADLTAAAAAGAVVPAGHGALGAFRAARRPGLFTLVRDHDLTDPATGAGVPVAAADGAVHDPAAPAGTTTVVVDGVGEVRESRVSLAGTLANSGGGVMPWGSWVTCEGTVAGPDVQPAVEADVQSGPTPTQSPGGPTAPALTDRHGYLFEVPADAVGDGLPVRAAGRFAHRGVALAEGEGAYYLTEDAGTAPSGFYRYAPPSDPDRSGRLEDGGRLSALAVHGRARHHLEAEDRVGATFNVEWVEVDEPDPAFTVRDGRPEVDAATAVQHVGAQSRDGGAALFAGLGQVVVVDGVVYFAAPHGGGGRQDWKDGDPPLADGFGRGNGQVWAYHPRRQLLELVAVTRRGDSLTRPHALAGGPSGSVLLAGPGTVGHRLRLRQPDGTAVEVARTRDAAADSEVTGAVLSPDGRTLFASLRGAEDVSVAVWGPWERLLR
ncbi:alkaline phosphatase PhoX [Thalassiella azotivora]